MLAKENIKFDYLKKRLLIPKLVSIKTTKRKSAYF